MNLEPQTEVASKATMIVGVCVISVVASGFLARR
jgi:hypothetical protein